MESVQVYKRARAHVHMIYKIMGDIWSSYTDKLLGNLSGAVCLAMPVTELDLNKLLNK